MPLRTIDALGDRYGRVRLLSISILIYSVGTGLTALSQTGEQFLVLRAITWFGIGGVFGLAVAIIAETFTGNTRVAMLAGLQVLSTVGNVGAALTKMGFDDLAGAGTIAPESVWRWLFAIGTLPIVLAAAAALFMRESDAWLRLKREAPHHRDPGDLVLHQSSSSLSLVSGPSTAPTKPSANTAHITIAE